MRRLLMTALAGILLATPASASPSPDLEALEALIAESAVTATDHAALGRYYRSRAALARANAEEQERMGRSFLYVAGNAGHQRYQQTRRAEIAGALREKAYAFEARALAHETAAREAGSGDANGIQIGSGEGGSVTEAQ